MEQGGCPAKIAGLSRGKPGIKTVALKRAGDYADKTIDSSSPSLLQRRLAQVVQPPSFLVRPAPAIPCYPVLSARESFTPRLE